MNKYLSLLLLPSLLFSNNKLHPDDPKSRPHHTLGFGVMGATFINGDQVFVGQSRSTLNNGSVYIYDFSDQNNTIKEEIFPNITGTVKYDFGHSISVDGNFMVVGAPSISGDGVGRAFIYKRSQNNKWVLEKEIIPNKNEWTTDFGSAVAVNGNFILIGDRLARDEDGMVYAIYYNKNIKEWTPISSISAEKIGSHGMFGHAIDIEENRALIGSRDGNIAIDYIFDETSLGWVENHTFTPFKLQSGGRFGYSVALLENKAFIGYPGYNQKGEVHVYSFDESTWSKQQIITNDSAEEKSYFGSSVNAKGNHLAVGSFNGENVNLFGANNGSYVSLQTLSPQNFPGSKFGRSLYLDENKLVVGATYGQIAYVYNNNGDQNWKINEVLSSSNRNESILNSYSPCSVGNLSNYYKKGGLANGKYPCSGIDFYAFVSAEDMGGRELNDIWGWTDPQTGKEIALVGLLNGVSFVDVSDPTAPIVLGILPTEAGSSSWRDVKVYKNHAYIVADNASYHGIQIFDLTQLRNISSFTTFQKTAYYDKVGEVHNIAINEETGFAYAFGIGTASDSKYICGAHIIDINDPVNPKFSGCLKDETTGRYGDGYVHDGQFIIYKGPDTDYYGKEIALTCNETALGIADVTDKSNLKIISKYESSNFRYIHQGWISENHKYFYTNDEHNEIRGVDAYQTTLVFDITDLDKPILANTFKSDLKTIDHNNYIIDTLLYQSNYSSGLRVLSIADPINPKEIAYFDTYPAGDKFDYIGSWSNYPYFESKTIVVSSIEEGLFVLKINEGEDLSVKNDNTNPSIFELEKNYPNPFNPQTKINYSLSESGKISLVVYNSLGQIVQTLENGYKQSGSYSIAFDGSSLPSGTYFYQLSSKGFVKTEKMSLIK